MMRYGLIIFCCIAFFACRNQKTEEPPQKARTIGPKAEAVAKAQPKADPPKKVEEKPKVDPRQSLLKAEYDAYQDMQITHSAAAMSQGEKEMLRTLLKAAELIEELHMLQIHPNNLEMLDRVMQKGTDVEKKLFARYQMPWCADNDSPECTVLVDGPKKEVGHVHWPEDFTDGEYEGLKRQINANELLSPFTIVRRKETGGFEAVPYAQTELFGPRMKQVATVLRTAAKTAPSPSLKSFLESRALAFESDEAFPYDASDFDWIALEGDWEVTVGPYEVYKNPRQQKAMFEMYIGREDKPLTAKLARFKENLQEMENALSAMVGEEIYKSRKLDPRISIRAVDIWMASGDGRRDRGATVAFHLPNRGEAVEAGLYKKVMMVNHSKAFEPVYKARAELVVDKGLLEYLDGDTSIANVAFHEFAHGFGAYHEMKVVNKKGKTQTVKQALKEVDSLFEELKADTFGLWLTQFQKDKGWVDALQEKKTYTSALMHILGLLQYPLDGTYPRMVAIQLGWYMDAGAIIWEEGRGRFKIDFEKFPKAVETLAKQTATIQLTGDYAQAKALSEKYITRKGKKEYELNGMLGQARRVMLDKFKEAGIKSPSLRYVITDLDQ